MNDTSQTTPQPPPGSVPRWLKALIGTPLVLLGGFVTVCLGIMTLAYIGSRIGGGHPEPGILNFFLFWAVFGALPFAAGVGLLAGSPLRHRSGWLLLLSVFLLFVAAGVDACLGPANWQRLFRRERFPGADAALLKWTIITPHLETPITPGTNVLWCGTFQLAWNEACRLTGGELRFTQTNQMISALNQHAFTRDSLDDASYVAMAGFVKSGIHQKLRTAVEQKFHGAFRPRFLPDPADTPRPQDFVAYACLYKNLSFPLPFERQDELLVFGGRRVPAFGIGPYQPMLANRYAQVLILDYQNENDFVIELKTKSDGDRLILAKIQPSPDLGETVSAVGKRIARGQVETAATNDLLLVPRMSFDLTREYSEIEGLHLIPKGTNVANDLVLLSAVQNTKFELNEKGAELKSEAHMEFGCAQHAEPVPRHKMIFDKPYLIMMQRKEAVAPYFALWVDNPEILVSWK